MRAIGMALVLSCAVASAGAGADERPRHKVPKAEHGGTVVGLCDGETTTEVKVAPGKALSREEAQAVSDKLMAEWQKKHPEANWDDALAQGATTPPPAPAAGATATPKPAATSKPDDKPATSKPSAAKDQTGIYTDFDARDELVWRAETQKFVTEGHDIFHNAKKLGGTIGISCDMCHPNAANTHPETYPKYQVQLQRVALLRDMINWCLENPVKAKALPDDSRTIRALEAYILAERKGQKSDPGKH